MSLQTIEIEAFSGPTSVLIGGGNQPTIVYINQGPAGSAGSSTWGSITGTLSSQTDLQDALDLKANLASPTFTGIVTAPRIEGKCAGLELFSKAGQAINAGQVVYVTGASGTNVIIGLAQANTESTSSRTIGVSESTLALNATGYVITEGLMTVSISSATALVGDPIWLSGTTAGGMLFGAANKPVYPYHVVYLGVVTRKTGNTIVEIYVKVQNGFELDELSDVLITTPLANQVLVRNSDKWINRALVSNDISDSSTGGNGTADAGKLVEFNSTGGVAVSTINNLAITAATNSTLTIEEDKSITLFDSITTEFGGYINTDVGGYIVTGVNGNITTGAGGYIQTGIGGHISTAAGGSFATGTGNLTGPNTSGTIALTSDIPPAATVDATVIDGSTNAVSGNAVFDALALKAPLADPTFTGEVVVNTLVGVNKDSLTINNTSDGDGQESYGLKINKSGVDSVGLKVEVLNVNDCRGIYSNVSGEASTGLVSVANGVSSKGASINSSGYSTKGLTVTADGEYSTGIVVESSGTENVGMLINSTVGDYQAIFSDTGTRKSFVARLDGAFGWFRGTLLGAMFTGRIQAADTLTEDRTYTLPDATGTVALINSSTGTQTFSGAQSFSGQVEFTGQAATNATSAMTRALVDERVMPQAHLPSRFVVGESDFISTTLNTAPYGIGFASVGAPGGASAPNFVAGQCSANHPGVVSLLAASVANSGGGISTSAFLPIVFGGGEEYTLIFKPVLDANTTRCRIGFAATIATTAPNYIAFAEGVGDGAGNVVFSAITSNFSGGTTNATTNATTYSAALGVWYQMRVVVNASAASVSFYLYSESGTLLWSVTNSTNIPTSNVQVGFTFYNTTILAGTILAYVDYHKFEINSTLIR